MSWDLVAKLVLIDRQPQIFTKVINVHANKYWLVITIAIVVSANLHSNLFSQANVPEISVDSSFEPQTLAKMAVIVSNNNNSDTPNQGLISRGNQEGAQSNQQRLVEDVFVQDLLLLGHVVVARSDLKSVLKEQALGQSGLTDSNAVEVGKLLNVPAVMVVRINEYTVDNQRALGRRNTPTINGRATVGARLIDVATGAILWQGNHSQAEAIDSPAHAQFLLGKVADRLAKSFPGKDLDNIKSFDPQSISQLALIMESKQSRGIRVQGDTNQQQIVEDKMSILLGNKGYSLVSRSDVQTLMKEKEFQSSGLTEENVTIFGKMLNVPVVLVVRMTDSPTPNSGMRTQQFAIAALGARLISVETGEVLWCRTYIEAMPIASKVDHSKALTTVAQKIGNMFPDRVKK